MIAFFELAVFGILALICIGIGKATEKKKDSHPGSRRSRTIRCPNCGSPADVHGHFWECPYCGDSGSY